MASINLSDSTASIHDQTLRREPIARSAADVWVGHKNVGSGEQLVSLAAGSILALTGIGRRDLVGLLIASVGGGLIYRGATGYCPMYQALRVNTAMAGNRQPRRGVHFEQTLLINKAPQELYNFWRNFENLPKIMSHLESVRAIDERTSHWVATAPSIGGGRVEWDAEVIADEPNSRIAWRSTACAEVANEGSVEFQAAPGDRGTRLRIVLDYAPPAGQLGHLVARLWGEAPEQQIREDLHDFKRIIEAGELPTTLGQPHGSCLGLGKLFTH